MKKLLFSCMLAGSLATTFSQQSTIDFESLNLSQADTFYNGADNAAQFTITTNSGNLASFSNYYGTFPGGDYWGGFAYSNMTDATTFGIQNQYSAISGNGVNNSLNYGLYYPDGTISFSQNTFIDSIFVTNTSYAYYSMLNGDAYGKKFGLTTNANGEIDGTNGEDFFKVWAIAMNELGEKTDSVDFYLADFRFADNSQDYILNTWKKIDLTALGSVKSLTFRFESSDMSLVYINTPTYFALDNLYLTNTLNVNDVQNSSILIFPNPVVDRLTINGFVGRVSVFDFQGKLIIEKECEVSSSLNLDSLEKGVYFLKLGDNPELKKIVKQ
jgi:hypothetical protein